MRLYNPPNRLADHQPGRTDLPKPRLLGEWLLSQALPPDKWGTRKASRHNPGFGIMRDLMFHMFNTTILAIMFRCACRLAIMNYGWRGRVDAGRCRNLERAD
jgi:hypothetical protein